MYLVKFQNVFGQIVKTIFVLGVGGWRPPYEWIYSQYPAFPTYWWCNSVLQYRTMWAATTATVARAAKSTTATAASVARAREVGSEVGSARPMLCQICYWFHWKQWNVRGRARRFSGNEANFGPNLHILIASPSQLDPFLNCQNEKLAKLKFKRCAYLYWYCSIYHSLTSLLVLDSVQKMLISTFCTFCSDHQSVPLVQDLNYDMIYFYCWWHWHTQRSAGRTLMYQMQKCSFSVTYNMSKMTFIYVICVTFGAEQKSLWRRWASY